MIYTHPRVFNARSKTSRVEAQILGREAWLESSIIETLIAKQVEADSRSIHCPWNGAQDWSMGPTGSLEFSPKAEESAPLPGVGQAVTLLSNKVTPPLHHIAPLASCIHSTFKESFTSFLSSAIDVPIPHLASIVISTF